MRIGIDLGGTKIEAVLLDQTGKIVYRDRVPTPKGDYDATLQAIGGLVRELESATNITDKKVPVGVGTPGAISHKTGMIKNSNNTSLNGRYLREDLSTTLSREVRLANDANCFALSEATDGAARDAKVMFGVILGTGVGGGVCVDRKIIQGANSIAGEWGHNRLAITRMELMHTGQVLTSKTCTCGRENCVESWLSGPSFTHNYQQQTGENKEPKEIARLAETGDETAKNHLEQYGHLLALALATVINLIDPEVIVLGGGMSNIACLYEIVPRYWAEYIFSDQIETKLVKAAFGDSSGVRGAAWLS